MIKPGLLGKIKKLVATINENKILKIVDFDNDHYIILVDSTEMDPWLWCDKSVTEIGGFVPSYDLNAFNDACKKRTIFNVEGK